MSKKEKAMLLLFMSFLVGSTTVSGIEEVAYEIVAWIFGGLFMWFSSN